MLIPFSAKVGDEFVPDFRFHTSGYWMMRVELDGATRIFTLFYNADINKFIVIDFVTFGIKNAPCPLDLLEIGNLTSLLPDPDDIDKWDNYTNKIINNWLYVFHWQADSCRWKFISKQELHDDTVH